MRILLVLVVLFACARASAESYLEKKDNDAIGIIERSLANIEKVPSLFDGAAIPAGVELQSVQSLLDQLSINLKAAGSSFRDLSANGARRADAQRLRVRYDELERYRAALAPALSRAQTDAETNARKQKADHVRAVDVASKVCKEFRAELRKTGDYNYMSKLTDLAEGRGGWWQDVEEGAKYKAALERTTAVCMQMPTAGASCALASNVEPTDARFCKVAAQGPELLKAGVRNYLEHHVKHSGPSDILKNFDRFKGYLDVDGIVTFKAYFSGTVLREMLSKRVKPLLEQASMAPEEADPLFDKIGAEFAALEAKARETAPTWELPGAACSGPGCAQAKKFVGQWYGGATIKRFLHTDPGWKILTNAFGVPTYRERYGFALVQVKGDPFCQLRMWTLSEQYAGGGRYTAARDVHLHSVRWQTCK